LNWNVSKEEIQLVGKHMRRYSSHYSLGKCKSRPQWDTILYLIGWVVSKTQNNKDWGGYEEMGTLGLSFLLPSFHHVRMPQEATIWKPGRKAFTRKYICSTLFLDFHPPDLREIMAVKATHSVICCYSSLSRIRQ
jgi:hypothetical protein